MSIVILPHSTSIIPLQRDQETVHHAILDLSQLKASGEVAADDIADYTDLDNETVEVAMTELREQSIIDCDANGIVIMVKNNGYFPDLSNEESELYQEEQREDKEGSTYISELAKVQAVRSESEIIGAFLEWCESEGMTLVKRVEPTQATDYQYRVPIGMSTNQLLAHYFHIDLEKVDQEQKAIIAEIRRNDGSAS